MKLKKILYIALAIVLITWTGFRIHTIKSESNRIVFNPARSELKYGAPVSIMKIEKKTGVLKEPIFIKQNIGMVSSNRIHKFKAGQKVGNGKIISVSNDIDLDSGMYSVRTVSVPNGMNFIEIQYTGFFIPNYVIRDNSVMVLENGIAQKKSVLIADQDSENAVIKSGLSDGETIILSGISAGEKVR